MIQAHGPPSPIAWCFGGFLFPVIILAIGLTFERGQVPEEADLAAVWMRPDTLSYIVGGLALGHAVGAALALARWPARSWVWLATMAQLACTLYAAPLAVMAVRGTWL
ncbi:MAG: hypothetical protein K1X57_08525 [Gemmataceae bacterium]|nr:hypothetical protein [Gemmataceae bacterium]